MKALHRVRGAGEVRIHQDSVEMTPISETDNTNSSVSLSVVEDEELTSPGRGAGGR